MGEQPAGAAESDRTSPSSEHDMLAVAHMRQGNTHEAGPGQPGPALPVSLQLRGHPLALGVGLEGLVAHLAARPSFHTPITGWPVHRIIWPTPPPSSRPALKW